MGWFLVFNFNVALCLPACDNSPYTQSTSLGVLTWPVGRFNTFLDCCSGVEWPSDPPILRATVDTGARARPSEAGPV